MHDCLRVKNAMSDILTDFGESQSPGKIDKTVTDQNSSKSPLFSGLIRKKNYYDPHEPHSAQNRPSLAKN